MSHPILSSVPENEEAKKYFPNTGERLAHPWINGISSWTFLTITAKSMFSADPENSESCTKPLIGHVNFHQSYAN